MCVCAVLASFSQHRFIRDFFFIFLPLRSIDSTAAKHRDAQSATATGARDQLQRAHMGRCSLPIGFAFALSLAAAHRRRIVSGALSTSTVHPACLLWATELLWLHSVGCVCACLLCVLAAGASRCIDVAQSHPCSCAPINDERSTGVPHRMPGERLLSHLTWMPRGRCQWISMLPRTPLPPPAAAALSLLLCLSSQSPLFPRARSIAIPSQIEHEVFNPPPAIIVRILERERSRGVDLEPRAHDSSDREFYSRASFDR